MRHRFLAGATALGLVLCLPVAAAPERGALVSRVHLIFDDAQGRVLRKTYTVWNPAPARGLEFEWRADRPSAAEHGLVSGSGRLVWRERTGARRMVSVYTGAMLEGRPQGQGTLRLRDGTRYDGAWARGLYEGRGVLQMADGSSYEGLFAGGRFHGTGQLVQADGEAYEGSFAAGLRHGGGKTRLPSGATYQSAWVRGVEVADSRRIRLAQGMPSGVLPVQFTPSDLRISFRTEAMRQKEDDHGQGEPISYVARTTAAGVVILPDDKALIESWDGTRSLEKSVLGGMSIAVPINVDAKIQNVGAQPVTIKKAALEFQESWSDLRPVYSLFYSECPFAWGDALETRLAFRNHGWNLADAVRLEVSFGNESGTYVSPTVTSAAEQKPSGTIIYDLKKAMAQLGVDLKYSSLDCSNLSASACLDAAAKSRAFGKIERALFVEDRALHLVVIGRLTYSWTDAKNLKQSALARFRLKVPLTSPVREFPNCAEAAMPPEYDPGTRSLVKLEFDKGPYTVTLPFRRALGKNAAAQIGLLFNAGKSSHHRFKLALEMADGRTIRSRDVDLTVVWPQTNFFDYQMNPYEDENPYGDE